MENVYIVQNQDTVDFKDPNEIKSFVAFSQWLLAWVHLGTSVLQKIYQIKL